MEKRFHVGVFSRDEKVAVIDMPCDEFNSLEPPERAAHRIVNIKFGGMISKELAKTYAQQIADQLNQFDVANATVAKLTA